MGFSVIEFDKLLSEDYKRPGQIWVRVHPFWLTWFMFTWMGGQSFGL